MLSSRDLVYRHGSRAHVKIGRALTLACVVVAAAAPGSARAEATAEQRAAAQALFDDARNMIGQRRWAEACPKLEESQRLDPGIGTLLNLAECQSQTGKTASAWANFLEAAYQAKHDGQAKREATARARAAALEARLSKLTILAVSGAAGGAPIEIKRDGVTIAPSLVGTAVPVDPGAHQISASAPGKRPWSTQVTVKAEGQQLTVSVPQLEDADRTARQDVRAPDPASPKLPLPPEEPPPAGPPPNLDTGRGPRAGGAVLLTLGIGGLVVAGVFTGLAKSKNDASNSDGCSAKTNGCTNQNAFDERNDARTFGNVATAGWVAGSVLSAGGIGLVVAAAVIKAKHVAVTPMIAVGDRGGATFGAGWRWQ